MDSRPSDPESILHMRSYLCLYACVNACLHVCMSVCAVRTGTRLTCPACTRRSSAPVASSSRAPRKRCCSSADCPSTPSSTSWSSSSQRALQGRAQAERGLWTEKGGRALQPPRGRSTRAEAQRPSRRWAARSATWTRPVRPTTRRAQTVSWAVRPATADREQTRAEPERTPTRAAAARGT